MSIDAVKRQILLSVDALTIPLNRVPSSSTVAAACGAAKLLRNRLLREHTRVVERIETLRERQLYDEASDEDADLDGNEVEGQSAGGSVSRVEFAFVCDLMVAEKLVIPLLLAHGMSFGDTLLPQLLKLLAVMLLPIPRFSAGELLQQDMLDKVKLRCGTDEFFALLVQCVAPIAEKRTAGELQREDVVILEIVLTLVTHLLDGRSADAERIIGAFCRNHGVELLLVVVNQNYARTQGANTVTEDSIGGKCTGSIEKVPHRDDGELVPARDAVLEVDEGDLEMHLDDGEDEIDLADSNSLPESQSSDVMSRELDREFQRQVNSLLESDEQLWKWNCLALAAIASVIWCVPAEELAHLALLGHTSNASPDQLLAALRNSQQLRECKKMSDKWRVVARSRHGAVTSNGILVRGAPGSSVGGRSIGTVFSLLGPRRKDPLDAMKDMDLRKRGRFVKGMFQGTAPQCNLPLPTKILLSQQNSSFLNYGFEPLSAMTFRRLLEEASAVERATKEHREVVAGYKGSGEALEVTSPLDTKMYQVLGSILHYMTICRCTLRYIRMAAEQLGAGQQSFVALFPQQWQSASSIISLDSLELGFSVLRSFLDCKDVRRRADVVTVVGYLAEILLLLHLLLQGELVADPAVEVAAHALASSVLYKEENIRAVFGVLSEYSSRVIAIRKAQVFTLFTFSVFQLIEKCSYQGSLLLPKRPRKVREERVVLAGEAADVGSAEGPGDAESIDSADLEDTQEAMLRGMEDMIDDGDSDDAEARAQRGSTAGEPEPSAFTSGVAEPAGGSEGDEAAVSERAASEGRPPSIASSGHTALSTVGSEREVAVSGFFHRLASPKNISLVYSTLRHWRVNDADVNIALTYLMDSLVRHQCESVFFNVAFLLLMREVLAGGEKTHAPLYAVCDRIVYDFFNPPFAKVQDARAAELLSKEAEGGMLSGAQSYLGFEVSLRCTRALFNFSTTDYTYIEERGVQDTLRAAAPQPAHDGATNAAQELPDVAAATADSPDSKGRRRRRDARRPAGSAARPRKGSESSSHENEEDGTPVALRTSPPTESAGAPPLLRESRRRHREKKRQKREGHDVSSIINDRGTSAPGNLAAVEAESVDAASVAAADAAFAGPTSWLDNAEETLVIEDGV
ncbi:hypothetical protein NESM_000420600 [Novymonas esmeraldas]|uniref:Timeless N-terminal domain-containing protein n=1 Tax=Novymonas esmeraldas TaxID=1808958 RepID=A0AAW0ELI0_9TRYP